MFSKNVCYDQFRNHFSRFDKINAVRRAAPQPGHAMTAVRMESFGCENPRECEEWYAIFKAFDVDNDGLIPLAELRGILHQGAYQLGLNTMEAELLMLNVDRDKDQMIDFTEFSCLMLRAKRMHMYRLMLYAARSVLPRSEQTDVTRYLLQYSCCPPPLFMFAVSLLQVAAYFYYVVESGEGLSLTRPVPIGSLLILNPNLKTDLWRYFTYMFIHIGYMHLLSNVVIQIVLGLPLELVHKFWRIALIYLLGVISGALLFFVVDQTQCRHVFLAGASGGVYALLSAHIANVMINWSEMEFNWLRTVILTVVVGADVSTVVYQKFFDAASKVSNISHLGGFFAGLLLGIVVLRNLRLRAWEAYAWWTAFTFFVFYVIMCSILIIAPPDLGCFDQKATHFT